MQKIKSGLPPRMGIIKKRKKIVSAGYDVEKLELSRIAGGNIDGMAPAENTVAVPETVKHKATR